MSESQTTTAPPPDQDPPPAGPVQQDFKKTPTSGIALSIWPPVQRTRDAVVASLIETLSTPSVLSKRYGTVPPDEASAAGRRIEEEAYDVASAAAPSEDDGLDILHLYSKEISKRMLDTVKSRVGSSSAADNSASETSSPAVATAPTTDEISTSIETEA
ncbi:hypothetical protein K2173_012950 [Erythroxylum novogranatense]|uniref:WPP domain-containing protein n=1 Tax=Erythroxylum novogranatense TaxID=1862640 RepID=A0AAV8S774_9ROSI|nr:hypothetical protein K2173_012950 [Erythroxylum novogranatense]